MPLPSALAHDAPPAREPAMPQPSAGASAPYATKGTARAVANPTAATPASTLCFAVYACFFISVPFLSFHAFRIAVCSSFLERPFAINTIEESKSLQRNSRNAIFMRRLRSYGRFRTLGNRPHAPSSGAHNSVSPAANPGIASSTASMKFMMEVMVLYGNALVISPATASGSVGRTFDLSSSSYQVRLPSRISPKRCTRMRPSPSMLASSPIFCTYVVDLSNGSRKS